MDAILGAEVIAAVYARPIRPYGCQRALHNGARPRRNRLISGHGMPFAL